VLAPHGARATARPEPAIPTRPPEPETLARLSNEHVMIFGLDRHWPTLRIADKHERATTAGTAFRAQKQPSGWRIDQPETRPLSDKGGHGSAVRVAASLTIVPRTALLRHPLPSVVAAASGADRVIDDQRDRAHGHESEDAVAAPRRQRTTAVSALPIDESTCRCGPRSRGEGSSRRRRDTAFATRPAWRGTSLAARRLREACRLRGCNGDQAVTRREAANGSSARPQALRTPRRRDTAC